MHRGKAGIPEGDGPRLALFTQGSHAIGMGHLYRAARLAGAFRRRFPGSRVLAVLEAHPDALELAAAAGLEARGLAPGLPARERAGRVADLLAAFRPHACVHDALESDAPLMEALRGATSWLATLDDAAPSAALADLVVNVLYEPPRPAFPQEVRGPRWALLDPAFAAQPSRPPRNPPQRLLAAQGGADTWGNLPRIARALRDLDPSLEVLLLAGPAFRHREDLARACAGARPRLRVVGAARDMPRLLAGCDLAVTGGGVMLYELAAAGVPCVAVTGEPKEMETLERLQPAGFFQCLGLTPPFPGGELATAVERLLGDPRLRGDMADAGKRSVDGRGLERLLDALAAALAWEVKA